MEFYNDKLIIHRKQSHLTADKIAKAMGICRTTYWRWEKGLSSPNRHQARTLGKILEIPVSDFSDLDPLPDLEKQKTPGLSENIDSWLSFFDQRESQSFKATVTETLNASIKLSNKLNEAGIIIKALLTGIDSMFYVKNIDLTYMTANDAFLTNISLKPSFIVFGKTDEDFFSSLEAKENSAKDERVLVSKESIVEECYIPGSKKRKWGIITRMPLFALNKKIVGLITNIVDITNRKKAEKMLNTLKECIDTMTDGMILQDVSGEKIFYYNKAVEKIFGYNKEDTLNKTKTNLEFWLNTCVHPDDKEKELSYMKKKEWPKKRQYRIIRPSGDVRWTESTITATYFGTKELHLTIISDITDRKKLEIQNNKLRNIIDSSDEVVWYGETDENNNLISMDFVNEALYKITGMKTEELTSCNGTRNVWHKILHKNDLESFNNWNKLGEFEYRIIHNVTGKVVWLRARNYMKGTTKYGFINDITELRNKQII